MIIIIEKNLNYIKYFIVYFILNLTCNKLINIKA